MKTTKNPWSPFWLKGSAASFLDEKSKLQSYQMRKFWFECMREYDIKQPVVDIGSGNGLLVQWLTKYAEENELKLDVRGIDAAELNPPNPALKLSAKTAYEDFTLGGNRKVGTFVSNYGLEYGELDAGLANLHRQLKRGGMLLAMLHSGDSVIVKNGKIMLDLIPSLIKQLKKSVYPLQQGLLKEGPGKLSRSSLQAQDALNRFAQKNERFGAFHAANFYPATQHLLKLAAQGQRQASEKVLDDYLHNIELHRDRLHTMLRATQNVSDTEQLKEKLGKVGFKNITISTTEFAETGVVGHFLVANK
ncbi:MAG: SAM-dependent methyltransferase [Pseudomonadota bacterium]